MGVPCTSRCLSPLDPLLAVLRVSRPTRPAFGLLWSFCSRCRHIGCFRRDVVSCGGGCGSFRWRRDVTWRGGGRVVVVVWRWSCGGGRVSRCRVGRGWWCWSKAVVVVGDRWC